jgi:predicted CoA-binding protein
LGKSTASGEDFARAGTGMLVATSFGMSVLNSIEADRITELLERGRRIAAYGVVEEPGRSSWEVCRFLMAEGFQVARPAAGKLARGGADMILVFPGADVKQAAADAIRAKVPAVWFEREIRARGTAKELAERGICVVYNQSIRSEYLSRWPPVNALYSDLGAGD